MASFNRVDIVAMLKDIFPQLQDMKSREINDFLNQQCQTAHAPDVPNSVVFDSWRQAIARTPGREHIWKYTLADVRTFKEQEADMIAAEQERQEKAKAIVAAALAELDAKQRGREATPQEFREALKAADRRERDQERSGR